MLASTVYRDLLEPDLIPKGQSRQVELRLPLRHGNPSHSVGCINKQPTYLSLSSSSSSPVISRQSSFLSMLQ